MTDKLAHKVYESQLYEVRMLERSVEIQQGLLENYQLRLANARQRLEEVARFDHSIRNPNR